MVKIKRVGNEYRVFFSDSERQAVDSLAEREFEIAPAKEGVWVLLENSNQSEKTVAPTKSVPVENSKSIAIPVLPANPASANANQKLDEKLFAMVSDQKQLSNRIVGKFEKTLNEIELTRFLELKKTGVIEEFKLNPSYKNPVYRLNERKLNNPNQSAESAASDVEFEKNGFAILTGDQLARDFSMRFEMDFKAGEIKGLKSFDGSFVAIRKSVYASSLPKIVSFLEPQKKACTIAEIAAGASLSPVLVTVVCEFLKEEGTVFEKTKGQFRLV